MPFLYLLGFYYRHCPNYKHKMSRVGITLTGFMCSADIITSYIYSLEKNVL